MTQNKQNLKNPFQAGLVPLCRSGSCCKNCCGVSAADLGRGHLQLALLLGSLHPVPNRVQISAASRVGERGLETEWNQPIKWKTNNTFSSAWNAHQSWRGLWGNWNREVQKWCRGQWAEGMSAELGPVQPTALWVQALAFLQSVLDRTPKYVIRLRHRSSHHIQIWRFLKWCWKTTSLWHGGDTCLVVKDLDSDLGVSHISYVTSE